MAKFTDKLGHEWCLDLTHGDLARVKKDSGLDLGRVLASEGGIADLLFGDPGRLMQCLYAVCEGQAQAAGVTPERFPYGFDGPAVERATEALIGALADFFPRSRIGRAIKERLAATLSEADEAGVRAVEAGAARSPT